ncbi:MAG: indolepyruvate/phenylpyruvate decarboxylase [Betaproteobacteria bacterium]|nr:indolepyruvate/phenylpyruvate decarboxylase [Betaproteobacteria bacterium]
MNLAQSLLAALRDHGAREIFGIPGDFALPLFKEIESSGVLPLYTLSHEPSVGFAADAAARLHCSLGVAAVTYGAGALNMTNAVAAAYAEKTPLVVLSGAPGQHESRTGLLLHHQAKTLDSQALIYREITCDQVRLDDARQAPALIARALASCRRESRPVYIEVPRDMVGAPCAAVVPLPPQAPDAEALAAFVAEILARLAAAERPVMMVGVEVRRHGLEDKVAALARRLRLPVVTSLLGRGLLANSDAPLAGTYLGAAGTPEIAGLVEESDALLLIGVIVSDTNFGVSRERIDLRQTIMALDGRVTLGYHTYPEIPLAALIDALLARAAQAARVCAVTPPAYPHGLAADDSPVVPRDIAIAINDLMSAHGRMPIAADVGDCLFTAMEIENTDLVAPGYYATMGYGVPAGLGVQAATGRRPLILAGDGAFGMTGMELGHCARYGWDPIVVVFNNAGWEMLRTFEPAAAFCNLGEWNFAEIARALGGAGVRVRTRRELRDALAAAHGRRGRFQLIEVMLARGAISPTLARFVAGARRLSAGAQHCFPLPRGEGLRVREVDSPRVQNHVETQ